MALPTTIVNRTGIFREYIGSKLYPPGLHDFPDIIDPNIREFHFIIAFASETNDGGRGNGKFEGNWKFPPIDRGMIRGLKDKHGHVKVAISIGGRGSDYPFNPADRETWPDIASASLIELINNLGGTNLIDGIDINYDTITCGDVNVFADCIGRLINILKKWDRQLVVSIAPQLSVEDYYVALFLAHGKDIAWVDYKFYTERITTADDFVRRYLHEREVYGDKLLAGFSTDPYDAGNLSREVFLDACEILIKLGKLTGIFIWDANDSYFPMERDAQALLTQK